MVCPDKVLASSCNSYSRGVAALKVSQDQIAREHFTRAAQLTKKVLDIDPKYAQAQYNYGVMLEKGRGVSGDVEAAAQWYLKAALLGDAKAQFNLGVLYYEGRGVRRDLKRSMALYTLSAAQGHEDAQYNLALLQDEEKRVARKW